MSLLQLVDYFQRFDGLTFLLLAQKKSKQKKKALNRTSVLSCTGGAAADIPVGRAFSIRDK